MKSKILNYIFHRYHDYFLKEVKSELIEKNLTDIKRSDLTELFENNKHFFELLLIKDFVGHIPQDVNEPALKAFEENGDAIEKWILWQSWYINRKALNDPMKILFYNGMMVYLKVLYTLANVNKKYKAPVIQKQNTKVEIPWIEQALSGVQSFTTDFKKHNDNKNEGDKDANNEEDGGNENAKS